MIMELVFHLCFFQQSILKVLALVSKARKKSNFWNWGWKEGQHKVEMFLILQVFLI